MVTQRSHKDWAKVCRWIYRIEKSSGEHQISVVKNFNIYIGRTIFIKSKIFRSLYTLIISTQISFFFSLLSYNPFNASRFFNSLCQMSMAYINSVFVKGSAKWLGPLTLSISFKNLAADQGSQIFQLLSMNRIYLIICEIYNSNTVFWYFNWKCCMIHYELIKSFIMKYIFLTQI